MEEMKQLDGYLIRDINLLKISEKAKKIVKQLDSKIDMPVVFWIDYPRAKSVTGRMPNKHNQFWVTVAPQKEQSEFERILIHNLYRGVMQTERYPSIDFNQSYINSNPEVPEIKQMQHLGEHIISFAQTILCHAHFSSFGISTSELSHEKKIEMLKNEAQNIRDLVHSNPRVIHFVVDLCGIACISHEYYRVAFRIADKAGNRVKSSIIKTKLMELTKIVFEFKEKYTIDNESGLLRNLLSDTIILFGLDGVFKVGYQYNMTTQDIQINGIDYVYSYLPINLEDRNFYIKSIKYINSALCMMQEYLDLLGTEPAKDFHINIAKGSKVDAFADGNMEKGYFITVTIPFLKRIKEYVKIIDVSSISENEKIFRDRLFKCVIFYVFFHEYAHIYYGDCDDANLLPQKEREDKADKFAEEMYLKVKILQYRFGEDSPNREVNNLMKNLAMDDVAFSMARNFLMVLRKEVQ